MQRAENLWTENKTRLPYPKSRIPKGAEITRLLEHHYGCWHDMFAPRQLLALATLLDGIMAERDGKLQEMLLCAFSSTWEANNLFTRARVARKSAGGQTAAGLFARHDYQPKLTIAENNVFGIEKVAGGSYVSEFQLVLDGLAYRKDCLGFQHIEERKREKVAVDGLSNAKAFVACENSTEVSHGSFDLLITARPYVGNVNYSELADFFYIWMRPVLKGRYAWFAPELTPKSSEIVENSTRGKSREDFYSGLSRVFRSIHQSLANNGLLVFAFHHTDSEGTVWEGLLQSLCHTGFEIAAVYPVHAESESSLHLLDKENVAYDLIHVCRKRREDPLRPLLGRCAPGGQAPSTGRAGGHGGRPLRQPAAARAGRAVGLHRQVPGALQRPLRPRAGSRGESSAPAEGACRTSAPSSISSSPASGRCRRSWRTSMRSGMHGSGC